MTASHPLPELAEPEGQLLHQRSYDVRAYRQGPDRLLVRGELRDQKPAGMVIADDPEPLTVHHMVVDLLVEVPGFIITEVDVVMATTPHRLCRSIEDDYQRLVGVSVARGFSRTVKDLFGGPRGCTHVGALLLAMAPAVIQTTWSLQAMTVREQGTAVATPSASIDPLDRIRYNVNTCHVWAEDGDMVADVVAGREVELPLWAERRLAELGRDPRSWRPGAG